jgi:hypothetical protein
MPSSVKLADEAGSHVRPPPTDPGAGGVRRSLHRHTLRQVPGLVHILAALDRHVVGEKL